MRPPRPPPALAKTGPPPSPSASGYVKGTGATAWQPRSGSRSPRARRVAPPPSRFLRTHEPHPRTRRAESATGDVESRGAESSKDDDEHSLAFGLPARANARTMSFSERRFETLLKTSMGSPIKASDMGATTMERGSSGNLKLASVWEIDPDDVLLEEFLGNGAYGAVYKGNWSGTEVAVKIVQEDLVYRTTATTHSGDLEDLQEAMKVFWAEVKLMRTLAHPNVVQFLGASTTKHPRMLLMEFLPNGTLDDVFEEVHAKNAPLSFETATNYALDTARGLAYLHHNPQRTVIHRDIKPGNLLLDKTGSVKVADFGLSKAVDESLNQLQMRLPESVVGPKKQVGAGGTLPAGGTHAQPFEQRGYQVGTYIYMPAELFRSRCDYTSKVDVYSFAMIMYELYEGRQPFEEYVANPMYAAAAAATGVRPEMVGPRRSALPLSRARACALSFSLSSLPSLSFLSSPSLI